MNPEEVEEILVAAGFQKSPGTFGLSESFSLPINESWGVTANCSFKSRASTFGVDRSQYAEIDFHLNDLIGTSHICSTLQALRRNLPRIIAILRENAATPKLLKCPKCKTRFVSPMTPLPGQTWKPFLSCKGMMVHGQRGNKSVICKGVSRALPAVVRY